MTDDPIVREVHKARQKLFELADGDMKKYMERLKESECSRSNDATRSTPLKPARGSRR
jgi:hypothetical protein